jgi:signal transduction histidine kinase/DNA-binding response OmpR family regulator
VAVVRGLAGRILPRVVIPTLIAGTLFGTGDWYLSQRAATAKAQDELTGLGRVAAQFIREDLQSLEKLGDVLLGLEELHGHAGVEDRVATELEAARLASAFSAIRSFELFEPSGQRLLAVVDGEPVGTALDASRAEWFEGTLQGAGWQVHTGSGELRLSSRSVVTDRSESRVVSITVGLEALARRSLALLSLEGGGVSVELTSAVGSTLFTRGVAPGDSPLRAREPLEELGGMLTVTMDPAVVQAGLRSEKLATGGLIVVLCTSLAVLLTRVIRSVVLSPLDGLLDLAHAFRHGADLPPSSPAQAHEIESLDRALREAAEESRSSARTLGRMNRDLEERVLARTKDLRRMRDQALDASRAKSQFLANMSHEIRTPMNGVLGMAEILGGTSLDEEQSSYLDVIRRSGDALLGVINDILDFSKIEAGRIDLEEVDFELVSSVHDIAALLAERAEQKGVELVFDADPRLPSHVIGDPARLRQVLMNLVGNAIKFTKAGTVQLRVRLYRSEGLDVEFQVKDSGIGIPEDALASIFDSFSQADISTTRKFGGTGLGLTISRKLVELMGGKLTVTSVEGEGSDFRFVLPLQESRQATNENTAAELLAGRRVLIVDDNASNRRILERQFRAIDVETVSAEDGLQAIQTINEEWAADRCFDFAVLDYQMPHMSGVELADRLAPLCKKSGMQMVLLSSALVLERGEGASLARRLTKPVRADLLFSTLAGLLPEGAEPIAPPPALPAPKEPALLSGEIRRVLLAEDNRVNQMVATKLLEGLGFQVDLAENGQEALDMVAERAYPVILMDCQMPIMDGYRATEEIKLVRPDQLVIAMTANAMQGDREKCLAAGMDDYFTKPIRRETLVEVLGRYSLVPEQA